MLTHLVKNINIINPAYTSLCLIVLQYKTFLCKASVKQFDTHYDCWYSACLNCAKQMHKDQTTGQLICQKHANQLPTPWYFLTCYDFITNCTKYFFHFFFFACASNNLFKFFSSVSFHSSFSLHVN